MQEILMESLNPILTALVQVVLTAVGGILIGVVLKVFKKLGIALEEDNMKKIEDTINKVVVRLNQTVVDDLKSKNPNGKLTDEEKERIFSDAKNIIFDMLDDNAKKLLKNRFGNENTAIDILIDNLVKENKDKKALNPINPNLVENVLNNKSVG